MDPGTYSPREITMVVFIHILPQQQKLNIEVINQPYILSYIQG